MNRQLRFNPYEPPAATVQDKTAGHPPWWAVIRMLAGASTLGIATGSMTWFGILATGGPAFEFIVVIAVGAGFLTARRSYRNMVRNYLVRNYWHKRTPLSGRPEMQAPVSDAERFRSSKETSRP